MIKLQTIVIIINEERRKYNSRNIYRRFKWYWSRNCFKTFEDNRMLDFCTPVIFASIKTMTFVKKHFKLILILMDSKH